MEGTGGPPCRAMDFVTALLGRLGEHREEALPAAASQAYTDTLYRYHGWVTSAAFTLALKVRIATQTILQQRGYFRGLRQSTFENEICCDGSSEWVCCPRIVISWQQEMSISRLAPRYSDHERQQT